MPRVCPTSAATRKSFKSMKGKALMQSVRPAIKQCPLSSSRMLPNPKMRLVTAELWFLISLTLEMNPGSHKIQATNFRSIPIFKRSRLNKIITKPRNFKLMKLFITHSRKKIPKGRRLRKSQIIETTNSKSSLGTTKKWMNFKSTAIWNSNRSNRIKIKICTKI